MRCCELELVNTGQVTMTNVHLVSMSPGLLSFGHSTNDDKVQLIELFITFVKIVFDWLDQSL